MALVIAASCRFPEYAFVPDGSAGSAGSGGGIGGGAGGGQAGASSGAGGMAGAGLAGATNAGGDAGASGAAGAYCGPVTLDYAEGCYDGITNGNETNTDCGGGDCQPCFQGSCVVDADCSLGGCPNLGCTRRFSLQYTSSEQQRNSQKISFTLRLFYENGSTPVALSKLRLRYYFRRNGVVEPIYVYNPNATLTLSGSVFQIATDVRWTLERVVADTDADFDTYLEISFSGPQSMVQGDELVLGQEIYPGGTARTFDQATHYSFKIATNEEWSKITLLQDDDLAWGYLPRGGGKPSCAYRAFNFNGPTLSIGDQNFMAGAESGVTSSGSAYSQSPVLYPAVTGELAQLISTGYTLTAGQNVSAMAPNGDYLAYVYAFSSTGGGIGTITLEDQPLADFTSGVIAGGQSWAKLGPVPVSIADGALDIGCTSGNFGVSALELRTPSDASY